MKFIDEYYLHCMSSGEFEIFFHVHCTQIHTARYTDMVSDTVCKICEHEKICENKKSKTKKNTTAAAGGGRATKQVVSYTCSISSIIILYRIKNIDNN